MASEEIDSRKKHLIGKVKKLPDLPGVYLMKDTQGKILYIGEASSLRKRVVTYFHKNVFAPNKELLVKDIYDIDAIVCESEAKALLLESTLIKEKKPKYNIELKDDKSFPLIEITKEDFPRVRIRRKKDKCCIYFGPYPYATHLREALKLMREIFAFRSCIKMPKKACLYYYLSLCSAPCIKKISKRKYLENIKMLTLILEGKRKELLDSLRKKMNKASDKLAFEEASFWKDKLIAVSSLYGIKREFQQLMSLRQVLKLEKIPFRIYAVDISNMGALWVSGSLVVFENGIPFKSQYRRFKIKTDSCDDLGRIQEVMERIIKRIAASGSKVLPDLIIIDGGLNQVNTTKKVLKQYNLNIPLIGISKKKEEIWFTHTKQPLRLDASSLALRLIQRLRDEAHRFAHKYHLALRKKLLVRIPKLYEKKKRYKVHRF